MLADDTNDLTVPCGRCHLIFHRNQRNGKTEEVKVVCSPFKVTRVRKHYRRTT